MASQNSGKGRSARKPQEFRDDEVFLAADLFFRKKKSPSEIGVQLRRNRQAGYDLLREARDRGYLRLVPPLSKKLASQVAHKFNLDRRSLRVVNVAEAERESWVLRPEKLPHTVVTDDAGKYVAAVAAAWTLQLIREVDKRRRYSGKPVVLGLGPGRATRELSASLGELLVPESSVRNLRLVAITGGGPAREPQYSSPSLFNLFPPNVVKSCVGLFAETLVEKGQLETVLKRPGVCEAYAERDNIDILISSMGFIEDEHDLLMLFMKEHGHSVEELISRGWVGSVQFRPFTSDGPIEEADHEHRVVSLFDIPDFVEIAKSPDRYVVLVARQCALCGRDRSKALFPLLTQPKLKVWSRIVMDVPTAKGLLAM